MGFYSKNKYAIILCGGESARFGGDKTSERLELYSVSRTVVEKFAHFDLVCVVLPEHKACILNEIWKEVKKTQAGFFQLGLWQGSEEGDFPESAFEMFLAGETAKLVKSEQRVQVFLEMWELAHFKKLNPHVKIAIGGSTRGESVRRGMLRILKETGEPNGVVLIHDGARPFVSLKQIHDVVVSAETYGSGVLAVENSDTLATFDGERVGENVPRNVLQIQTPQGFDFERIMRAYASANGEKTDDAQVYAELFGSVRWVRGSASNFKITYKEDLAVGIKIGVGYDVHQLETGRKFILGGVEIPNSKGMVAHSDGDVLCHAVADSLLSAVGGRDIGYHFPDTDEKYKGISSIILLEKCVDIAREKGYTPTFVSAVVACQKPKLSPHIEKIRSSIAKTMGLPVASVNIGATTTEGLGVVGEEKGIAVKAMCGCKMHGILQQ